MTAARRVAGLALVGAGAAAVAFFTLVLLRGMVASGQPELRAWHRALRSEIRARDLTDRATLADYLRREEVVFAELSEAYFGRNDFYPFTRKELEKHDPAGYRLMRETWGDPRE